MLTQIIPPNLFTPIFLVFLHILSYKLVESCLELSHLSVILCLCQSVCGPGLYVFYTESQ